MGEPHGGDNPGPDRCPICPECQSPQTAVRLRTAYGVYCRCHGCGYVWQDENQQPLPPPPADDE